MMMMNYFSTVSRPVCQPRLHPADLGGCGRSHPELPHWRQTSAVQGADTHAAAAATLPVTLSLFSPTSTSSSLCRRTSCSPEAPPCSGTLADACRGTSRGPWTHDWKWAKSWAAASWRWGWESNHRLWWCRFLFFFLRSEKKWPFEKFTKAIKVRRSAQIFILCTELLAVLFVYIS